MKIYLILFLSLFLFGRLVSQEQFISISGVVTSSQDNEPVLNALVQLKLSSGGMFEEKTDSLGQYEFKIKNDSASVYSISVVTTYLTSSLTHKKCGFLAIRDEGKGELKARTTFIKNFQVVPTTCGGVFPKIVFKKNSIISCNESLFKIDSISNYKFNDALNLLYTTLLENPSIVIELQGHASTQENNHEELSLNRAQLIKEILISKGINPKRIKIKGWGINKLLIIDSLINKTNIIEEKEMLHTKNQRVVFKILNWDFKE